MRPSSWDCPYCESAQEFILVHDQKRHLRQCSHCGDWFIIHEAPTAPDGTGSEIEELGYPAECPVDGCVETFEGDGIVDHLLEQHDGSLPDR